MKLIANFKTLTKGEWLLWICSVTAVILSFLLSGADYILTLVASLIGVTALIFLAKGNVWGQILSVVFSIIYAIISYSFQYYGEMITYLGMTMPIAIASVVTWLKHPFDKEKNEVEIAHFKPWQWGLMLVLSAFVTFLFYFILKYFHTANLVVSTISITTSFLAVYMLMFRIPFYALAYAANDVVLIILWILASLSERSYLAMVVCFLAFLVNDTYGFVNWRRMEKRQLKGVKCNI